MKIKTALPFVPRYRRSLLVAIAGAAALVVSGMGVASQRSPASAEVAAPDPVVMAAGDIACPTTAAAYNGGDGTATQCRQKYTADLLTGADAVLALGDEQYSSGLLSQFKAVYDPTWGRMKSVTYPAPGDHEYASGNASGYFAYFGKPEYYSFDIGSWHFLSLNSEIDHAVDSVQEQWVRGDLAATDKPCIGAFWGSPTFSSGVHGRNASFTPFWDDLYAAHADLVLAGDDHDYERFAKQKPDGTAASDGIRQFVVGTGGRNLSGFKTIQPNSQARAKVFGVLELRLGASDYGWNYHTESGGTFTDSGTASCNPKLTAPTPSSTPTETVPTTPTETVPTTTTETVPTTTTTTGTTATCLGTTATIVGTAGADTITGTSGRDIIAGLGGNDRIDGGGGDDVICGAGGSDQIDGGAGNDQVNGGASADTLTDSSGVDVLNGSTGDDTLNTFDSANGDTVNGGSDNDTCSADAGDKILSC